MYCFVVINTLITAQQISVEVYATSINKEKGET